MLTTEQKRNWILENCVDEDGDINLRNLDFSEFDGSVYTSHMKVKRNLHQDFHTIHGCLFQSEHNVRHQVHQGNHNVGGDLYQGSQVVKGCVFQSGHVVEEELFQSSHEVGEVIWQKQHVKFEKIYSHKPTENEEMSEELTMFVIREKTKQLTMRELEDLVGGKFEIVEEQS